MVNQKNVGLQWTDELKEEVASLYSDGKAIDELAEHLEKTKVELSLN